MDIGQIRRRARTFLDIRPPSRRELGKNTKRLLGGLGRNLGLGVGYILSSRARQPRHNCVVYLLLSLLALALATKRHTEVDQETC